MHRKYCNTTATTITVTITTITVGVTAESIVTPTVIVTLSVHHALSPAVIDSDSKLVSRSQTPPLSDIGTVGKESGGIPFLNLCQLPQNSEVLIYS